MDTSKPRTVLCIAGHEKGQRFIQACKRQGCRVLFLTTTALREANWPRESIDETFYLPDLYNQEDLVNGVSYLARGEPIELILPLDDFDIEHAAHLREHFRLPGLTTSQARLFRDKLAMRVRAREAGVLVPDFVHVLNYDRLRDFMARVPPPWFLKPRSEAAAIGIRKLNASAELWPVLDELGDRQSHFVLERYVPGDVYHVDALVWDGRMGFAEVHQYGQPPFDVMHHGGIFITRTVERGGADDAALRDLGERVIAALGLPRGATHMEFIRGREDGQWYFLETAARVGGANITDMVEAATGISLWEEWAKIELAYGREPYSLPARRYDYGAIIQSLARQEYPDTAAYQAPEIELRLTKPHHAGFVLASPDRQRIDVLLDEYSRRFYDDFFAALPAPDKVMM